MLCARGDLGSASGRCHRGIRVLAPSVDSGPALIAGILAWAGSLAFVHLMPGYVNSSSEDGEDEDDGDALTREELDALRDLSRSIDRANRGSPRAPLIIGELIPSDAPLRHPAKARNRRKR